MSGRGGRGGWRGRGRGNPTGPVAKDDDGNIVDSTPAGPPPLFPQVDLPHHPEISSRDQMLLLRRHDLMSAAKRSPFFLEMKDDKKEDVEACLERFMERAPPAPPGAQQGAPGGGSAGGAGSTGGAAATGAGAAGGAAAGLPPRPRRKRGREPLTSVIKLLPEYFPQELYSTSDKKHAKFSDSYWKRAGSDKKDDAGLLDAQLAMMERAAAGAEAAAAANPQGAGDDEGPEVEEEPRDTDDEEDMDNDDYYQGEHFDDDEGYDDAGDDGGGEGTTEGSSERIMPQSNNHLVTLAWNTPSNHNLITLAGTQELLLLRNSPWLELRNNHPATWLGGVPVATAVCGRARCPCCPRTQRYHSRLAVMSYCSALAVLSTAANKS